MKHFALKDGKIVDSNGDKLPIAEVREILAAAVRTAQKYPLLDRKKSFFEKIADWRKKHPTQYPADLYNEFYSFWTAVNDFAGTEKMKVELTLEEGGKTAVFDIGRRLATFWKNCDQATKNLYWTNDEKTNNQPKQGTLL